jgi:Protein of unknown function (DUF1501)
MSRRRLPALPGSSPQGRDLLDRRRFLGRMSGGLTGIALFDLLDRDGLLAAHTPTAESPLAPRPPHFPPRARRVVQLYCAGAISHVDTWDYKPELIKRHDQPMPGVEKLITFLGENGNLIKSPWTFRPRGETGKMVSDLLPRLAELTDELCFIHSMTSKTNTHGPGEMFLHTGFTTEGFPSIGSWVSYALGTENQDLPSFVALLDPRGVPQQGPASYSNGFLPAAYQGTAFNADKPISHLNRPAGISAGTDQAVKDFVLRLDDEHLGQNPGDTELAARIAAYELAARMQLSVPEVADLTGESRATRALYGLDDPDPIHAGFGRNCLLARRLLERGVRFITVYNGAYANSNKLNWDAHFDLEGNHANNAAIFDRPAAALLLDLKERGMLDDTLVLCTTEFGRMPTFQKGAKGRDHNPKGFTVWLAGAGVKRAFSFGATDEFGYNAVENVVDVHDFHATVLHLLGLDHQKLTYYHNGTQRRLTDVHGHLIREILA